MELIITDEAQNDLLQIEDYLLRKWSFEVVVAFNEKYDSAVELICNSKVKFVKYGGTEVYKYLLTKHNSIIYKIDGNKVIVLKILQNFKDPDQNFKDILEL